MLAGLNLLQAQISLDTIQTITTGSWARIVLVKDINNDGLNDLVVGCSHQSDPVNDYTVKIYYQDTLGLLSTSVSYNYPVNYPGLSSMAIGDLNNDGYQDLIIALATKVYVAYQTANGGFTSFNIIANSAGAYFVQVADLNNDGLDDIVVNHSGSNSIKVLYQVSNSSLFTSVTYPRPNMAIVEIEIGDVNNDGLLDVVCMGASQQDEILVYTQNNFGTLNNYVAYQSPSTTPNTYNGIAIGDVNHDGLNDVVATKGGNTPYGQLVVWLQNPITNVLGSTPSVFALYEVPTQVEIADLDCDGKSEIIVGHWGWHKTSITQLTTTGLDTTIYYQNVYGDWNKQGLAVGDLNSDGRKDIVQVWNSVASIKYNTTAPKSQDYQLAPVVILLDSGYTNTLSSTSYYVRTRVDSSSQNYIRVQIDSFLVTQTVRLDSIWVDSIFINEAFICAKRFADSTFSSGAYLAQTLMQSDTVFWSTSILLQNPNTAFRVYPNPSQGVFFIELPNPFDLPNTRLTIYSSSGQLLEKVVWPDSRNKRSINIGRLGSGVYILHFQREDNFEVVKVVLEN